jgi:hypothetical protein
MYKVTRSLHCEISLWADFSVINLSYHARSWSVQDDALHEFDRNSRMHTRPGASQVTGDEDTMQRRRGCSTLQAQQGVPGRVAIKPFQTMASSWIRNSLFMGPLGSVSCNCTNGQNLGSNNK